jgi:hypothetical protein
MSEERKLGEEIRYPVEGREPIEVVREHLPFWVAEQKQLGPDYLIVANMYDRDHPRTVGIKCEKAWP